mgnify:CR=1 FL=1|tara:strand:- start:18597 stop:19553 length:957 start_codon:yes stop_codon:yes gene_type:complete
MKVNDQLLSIIIPVYNREYLIAETLNAIINQEYKNWECLVIDDGSTDNTVKVVQFLSKKDSRISIHIRPPNLKQGGNAARNYGFDLALGEYITWVDSDDLVDIRHYIRHIRVLQKNPEIYATISKAGIFHKQIGDLEGVWSQIYKSQNVLEDMICNLVSWPILGVCWRKTWFSCAPFSEEIISGQEWLMHVNQLINGLKFEIINDVTSYVRRHSDRKGMNENPLKYLSRFNARFYVYNELKKNKVLSKINKLALIKSMIQNIKKITDTKSIRFLIPACFRIMILNISLNYRFQFLRILIVGIPLKLFFTKGERFFYIN